jgi:hypothetical protein
MKYTLTFSARTAKYACHAINCTAAQNPGRGVHGPFGEFETIAAAREYANDDESSKAGEPTKAGWNLCKCARPAKV